MTQPKQTAANNAYLNYLKRQWNAPIYRRASALMNADGEWATRAYIAHHLRPSFTIDPRSSSYVDVIRIDAHRPAARLSGEPIGSIKRGHNTRTETCPDIYFAGVGECAQPVARVWPDGLEPETNPTPHIPYTTHAHAMSIVATYLHFCYPTV